MTARNDATTATCDLHSVHKAGCADCKTRAAARGRARTRAIAYGTHRTMQDPGPARDHILRLHHDHGMSGRRIAEKAGISKEVTRRLINGSTSPMHPRVYDAILATTPDGEPASDRYLVSALGASRMLQALCARGHHIAKLAAELGIQEQCAARWRRMHYPTITVASDRAVRTLYGRLADVDGGHEPTRAYARTQQWAPPGAWNCDEDLDDPGAAPDLDAVRDPIPAVLDGRMHSGALSPDERLRVVEYLIALRRSDRQIADELQWPGGIGGVQQYRIRHQLPIGRRRGEPKTSDRMLRDRRRAAYGRLDQVQRAVAIDRFDFGQPAYLIGNAVGCNGAAVEARRLARGEIRDVEVDPEAARAVVEGRLSFSDLNDGEREVLFRRYAGRFPQKDLLRLLRISGETYAHWRSRISGKAA